ncbi:DUF6049 family protein [Frigoribacterium faeni]|uniref:Uncharacterized protein n=1 Tax=Frigoribacterium faeni TaxID=145483 RepID=A0A7W3JK71_9MICO|nr:DUF6049 family protein [Frigoribacterium faeni]MBA8814416.1 hypothetical protein [Frigoribacterium faeni]GEK84069.1 hypothetical protein FFA01_23780 [Frigoribacterium faeni]
MRLLPALLALVTTLGVAGAALPAEPASAASAGSSAAAASSATGQSDAVTLSVAPEADGVLRSGDDLELSVTVTNGTETDLDAGSARIYLDRDSFLTRSKLADWLSPDETTGDDYLGIYMARVDVPAVAAGESVTVDSITIPASRTALDGWSWGARALGVRLLDSVGVQVAQARSSVVWYPSESFQPTRLSVAVPITTPETENGVLDAAALEAYTSADGTLTRQLRQVVGTSATIAVDPMIIASIRLLGSEAPASALGWLDDLSSAGVETFPLTYADADVAGLSQAGAPSVPGPTSFDGFVDESRFDTSTSATDAPSPAETDQGTSDGSGSSTSSSSGSPADPSATETPSPSPTDEPSAPPLPTTESLLSFPWSLSSIAWPADDTVVSSDIATITSRDYTSTILSSSNVNVATDATENAPVDLGGSTGLVSDDTLSGLIREAAAATSQAAWRSAMAELSASVATIAKERPSDARTMLATLDRSWSTDGGRLRQTLAALDDLPWSSPSSLSDTLAAEPTDATVVDEPESADRLRELRSIVRADEQVTDFSTALEDPLTVTGPARLRTLALSSHAWRDNPDGLSTEVDGATQQATETSQLVSIVQGSDQLILGDRSSLPLYVQNASDSSATVFLTLAPSSSRLTIEENRIPVTVQAKSQVRVRVPVQSIANGTVNVSLSLVSSTGVTIATPAVVTINVQAGWETAITWAFGIGFALLFGGGIYRTIRKRRRGAARDDDGDDDSDDSDYDESGVTGSTGHSEPTVGSTA